jgi:hypothetical protein
VTMLVYLNWQSHNEVVNACWNICSQVVAELKTRIVILCESELNKKVLDEHNYAGRFTVLCLSDWQAIERQIEVDNKMPSSAGLNYLYECDRSIPSGMSDIRKSTIAMSRFLEDVLKKHEIKLCLFLPLGGVYQSVGMVLLQDQLFRRNLPTMIYFATPMKGRFSIYDDVFLRSKSFEKSYLGALKKKPDHDLIQKLEKYFDAYREFKLREHLPRFTERREKLRRGLTFFGALKYGLRRLIKKRIESRFMLRNAERPYFLFLLSKPKQWYSTFASPELLNRDRIVRAIYEALPMDYDLVLKPHPHMDSDSVLDRCVRTLDRCYGTYESEDGLALISQAEIVFSAGTSSGVEALIERRHVIEIGARSAYFDFSNPPVKRARNLKEVPEKVKECLSEEVPESRIHAYFLTLLERSYSITSDSNCGSANHITLHKNGVGRNEEWCKLVAGAILDRIGTLAPALIDQADVN